MRRATCSSEHLWSRSFTGNGSVRTATFEDLPEGRTKFTGHSVFLSVADRDGMIQSGMEWGVRDSHERLDELLAKMKATAGQR